jgi:hypothetical protein
VIYLILDYDKDALIMDSPCSFDVATTKILEPTISDNEFVRSSTLVELGSVQGSNSTQATIPEVINTLDADVIVIYTKNPTTKRSRSSKEHKCLECGNTSRVFMIHFVCFGIFRFFRNSLRRFWPII